jgi:branched-chain amino acid transport system ATP-binding protein
MHAEPPLLITHNLQAGYGHKQILNEISIHVHPGEIVALLGSNGAGKSTLLKTIFGLISPWNGIIYFAGRDITNLQPSENVRVGLAYVPQGSRVFSDLTVQENLELGGFSLSNEQVLRNRITQTFNLFPILYERRRLSAGKLSGGEKQMLALGQALVSNPKLMLLDEPSLGLAPQTTHEAMVAIRRLNSEFKTAILIVEQNVSEALSIAHRAYALRLGKITIEEQANKITLDILHTAFFGTKS